MNEKNNIIENNNDGDFILEKTPKNFIDGVSENYEKNQEIKKEDLKNKSFFDKIFNTEVFTFKLPTKNSKKSVGNEQKVKVTREMKEKQILIDEKGDLTEFIERRRVSSKNIPLPLTFWQKLSKIKNENKLEMFEMIYDYYRASIGFDKIFLTLSIKERNYKLKIIYKYIYLSLLEGRNIGEVFDDFPELVDDNVNLMVKVGVKTGNLGLILPNIVSFYKEKIKLKKQISSATIYPKIVMGFVVFLLTGFFTVMFPKILGFVGADKDPTLVAKFPMITQISYKIYLLLTDYIFITGTILIVFIVVYKKIIKPLPFYTKYRHERLLSLPGIGDLIRNVYLKDIFFNLYIINKSGINVLNGINIMKNSTTNFAYYHMLSSLGKMLESGESFFKALIIFGVYKLNRKSLFNNNNKGLVEESGIYVIKDKDFLIDDNILMNIDIGNKTGTLGERLENIFLIKSDLIKELLEKLAIYIQIYSLLLIAPVVLYMLLTVMLTILAIKDFISTM